MAVGIPDAIITKPARLTEEEYEEIKRHPEIGARIRAVAGCRWPPEMLSHARLLNEELLERRPGTDALREAREKCARFRKHPCSKL